MDRRLRTNVLLALAVTALALAIWLAPEPEAPATFRPVDPATIDAVHVRRGNEPHLSLQKRDGAWWVVAPFELPAEPFQVDALLASLGEPAGTRYPVESADLAELGLENPKWTVDAGDVQLQLGGRAAVGNRRYLRAGDFVYLVNDVLSYRLQRPALDYAARRLLPPAAIASIALPNGTRLEKADGQWSVSPEKPDVSADELQALVNGWRNAIATSVTHADSVPRQGDVEIGFEDGSTLRLGVELTDSDLKLTRDRPAVTYTLPASESRRLLQLPQSGAGAPVE